MKAAHASEEDYVQQELQQLLVRTDGAETHYEALSLTAGAGSDAIKRAYQTAVSVLYAGGPARGRSD